jgi:hypothetical protein
MRITLIAMLLIASLALGQGPSAKPLSPFEQELVNNEQQFLQALQGKNAAYVSQAVSDDFRGIATNGDFYDRGELVWAAKEGMPPGMRAYDFHVVQLSDNSAVVAYNFILPGDRPRYRHMSDTWTKQSGQWKLKFQQATPNLWSATDLD